MTLNTTASRASYIGTGTAGPFAFPFRIFSASDLKVTLLSAAGVKSQLAYLTHFTVAGAGNPTGTVTLLNNLAVGDQIFIRRAPPVIQDASIRNQGISWRSAIEDALDALVMIDQKQQDEIDRSFKLGETVNPVGVDTTLPHPTAGYVMTGTGSAFTMSPLDSSAIALPGEGRTVATTSAYLSNNRVFCLDDYVPVGVNIKTNVTDATTYIQSCWDQAITNQGRVKMRHGIYKTTAPLFIMKFAAGAYTYVALDVEGEKYNWEIDGTVVVVTTRIVPTHKDTFAIGIQNGRSVRLADIVVSGQNDFSANIDASLNYLRTNANFVTNACRDSRYSPYSGIVVDPFGTALPADGGYPGLAAYYVASASGSASLQFERVVARGFVANFCLSPNGTIANCSEMNFNACWAEIGKVGLAIGQDQSRSIFWTGGSVTNNLYGFDGNTYGKQQGSPPKIFGVNMSGKYLFNVSPRWGGVLLAIGIHAESFFSIGFLGSTFATARTPFKFLGCEFNFGYLGSGKHADRHLYALTNVEFDTCMFENDSTYGPPVFRFVRDNACALRFRNCEFIREKNGEWTFAPSSNSGFIICDDLHFESCLLQNGGTRGHTSGNDRISHRMYSSTEAALNKNYAPFLAEIRLNSNVNIADRSWVGGGGEALYQVNHGLLAVVANADGTATFTVPDGTVVRTGDLAYTTTAFNIEKYDGTTETMPALCLGIVSGIVGNNVTIDGIPQSLVNGNYTIVTFWWPRYHQATTGDVTNASPTILNVSQPAAWAIGNKIRGLGIPTGTFIVNIVGSTFTLSKNATATNVGTRLYDADVYKITGTAV